MLPIKLSIAEYKGERPKEIPSGIAPRSSITGKAAAIMTASSLESELKISPCILIPLVTYFRIFHWINSIAASARNLGTYLLWFSLPSN